MRSFLALIVVTIGCGSGSGANSVSVPPPVVPSPDTATAATPGAPTSMAAAPSGVPSPDTAPTSMAAAPSASAGDGGLTPQQMASLAAQADAMQSQMLTSINGKMVVIDARDRPGPVGTASTPATTKSGAKGDVQIGGESATIKIPNAARVLAALRPRFRGCYEKGLESEPSMSGRLVLGARVGPNGEVSSADVTSNAGLSPATAACAIRVLKSGFFDPPGGSGSTLSVPVTFTRVP